MYYYRLYETNIASDLLFRQLYVIEECQPDVVIKAGIVPEDILALQDSVQGYVGEKDSLYIHPAFYLWVKDGNRIVYEMREDISSEFIEQFGREFTEFDLCQWILGAGIGLLGLQRGCLPIHCSALSKNGEAMIVCGQSGAGKSTITSQLLKAGWNLVADDISWLEYRDGVTYAKPAFPYQKLCRDMAEKEGYDLQKEIYVDDGRDKFIVKYNGEFSTEAVPLKHMICMGVKEKGDLEHHFCQGMEAFYMISNNMYIYHMLGEAKYGPEIVKRCMKVASSVSVDAIIRPACGGTLQDEIRLILEAVSNSK